MPPIPELPLGDSISLPQKKRPFAAHDMGRAILPASRVTFRIIFRIFKVICREPF
jgi:hypothetical protein